MALRAPVRKKELYRVGNELYRIGSAEMQGYRSNLQDGHLICAPLPTHPDLTVLGVFDGHGPGGEKVAEWLREQMPSRLAALSDPTDSTQLRACVEQADRDLLAAIASDKPGSTLVLAVIKQLRDGGRELTVANVGDSRCLVLSANDGSVKFATVDHKPNDPKEKARIVANGGTVERGRVDGVLAMSRAMGDGKEKSQDHITAAPSIFHGTLAPTDLILVCCDGILEEMTNEQVGKYVFEKLRAAAGEDGSQIDPAAIMVSLLEKSLREGSTDNMTAILCVPIAGSDGYGPAHEQLPSPTAAATPESSENVEMAESDTP